MVSHPRATMTTTATRAVKNGNQFSLASDSAVTGFFGMFVERKCTKNVGRGWV